MQIVIYVNFQKQCCTNRDAHDGEETWEMMDAGGEERDTI